MNNPWYNAVNGIQGQPMQSPPMYQQPQAPANPFQLAGEIANAMRNPVGFAMNAFRDVPRELWNDPAKALQYIQQTRNISQADIQNMINSLPFPR